MWNNTKKTAITVKQMVAPLQANEVANIRKKSASFDVRQHKFREIFRKIAPFFYHCEDPYDQMDTVSLSRVWQQQTSWGNSFAFMVMFYVYINLI